MSPGLLIATTACGMLFVKVEVVHPGTESYEPLVGSVPNPGGRIRHQLNSPRTLTMSSVALHLVPVVVIDDDVISSTV